MKEGGRGEALSRKSYERLMGAAMLCSENAARLYPPVLAEVIDRTADQPSRKCFDSFSPCPW